MSTGTAIEASGLGKRYGRTWALRDCSLAIPSGHVVGLVGPNGAGKTTLLSLAVGLATPTTGQVRVAGGRPAGSAAALDAVAFVAQEAALYRNLSVADTLRLGRSLNRRWDGARARDRLAELGIPLEKKIGALSGGQRSQMALTLALAKCPELLILDEPLAALDPVARHEFMSALMAAVLEDGVSVVFSSHVVNMDGSFFAPVPATGLGHRPVLLFGAEHEAPGMDPSWEQAWGSLDGWKRWLTVTGSDHGTFTDLPILYAWAGRPGPGISPRRAEEITRAYVGAFFDLHLKRTEQPLLDGPSPAEPEVTFQHP
ncbi:ABC transporter ATP-binding protein [Sphaerisporangium fuscum]|uniref:ABC transporter ATP-binding protein n=1 Tax=Sphaerisporangium fuscum TaxID=2835868 RepID=UPI001BDDC67C|nr:ATP-binding cassette domain-containing protein [Sphaerisporangium fuscum]